MDPARRQFLGAAPAMARTTAKHNGPHPDDASLPAPDDISLLLSRATFGARQGEVERARAIGYSAWIEEQLAYESIDDSAVENALHAAFPTLSMSNRQLIENSLIEANRFQALGEAFGLDDVGLAAGADLVVQELAQGFQREVLFLELLDLCQELIGQDRDVGCGNPGGRQDVDDFGGHHGAVEDLLNRELARGFADAGAGGGLGERGADGLEEADGVTDRARGRLPVPGGVVGARGDPDS